MKDPQVGEKWIHHSGRVYTVCMLTNTANSNPDYPVAVVYIGNNGNLWSRTLAGWHEKFTKFQEAPQ